MKEAEPEIRVSAVTDVRVESEEDDGFDDGKSYDSDELFEGKDTPSHEETKSGAYSDVASDV